MSRRRAGDYLTAAEAGEVLGLTRRAVLLLAKRRGLGRLILGHMCFTEAEVDRMRDRRGGPPTKKERGR